MDEVTVLYMEVCMQRQALQLSGRFKRGDVWHEPPHLACIHLNARRESVHFKVVIPSKCVLLNISPVFAVYHV